MPAVPVPVDEFDVQVLVSPAAVWVHATGEIDLATAPELHAAVDRALGHGLPVWPSSSPRRAARASSSSRPRPPGS